MGDTPSDRGKAPSPRLFHGGRDYGHDLQPAAIDSELLCWLPTPDDTLAPPLPEKLFIEPVIEALLVTGGLQPSGVTTC